MLGVVFIDIPFQMQVARRQVLVTPSLQLQHIRRSVVLPVAERYGVAGRPLSRV